MPELPEVETVRLGLARGISGRRIDDVEVDHPRAVRRHVAGAGDFTQRLRGASVDAIHRRGKYLWLALSTDSTEAGPAPQPWCLVAHLGMSGQLLIQPAEQAAPAHLRVTFRFADGGTELRFVDQRTFGGLVLDRLVPAADGGPAAETVPSLIAHIARDPLDPAFDETGWRRKARRRQSAVKRVLLDQTVISGVGNIYADEALWRSRLHGLRPAPSLRPPAWSALLGHLRAVLGEALTEGGTSFDALYVNVNGQSGYFDRSLAVYGQAGRPCPRCATPIRRSPFMNRSSFWCPRCQRPPRTDTAGLV